MRIWDRWDDNERAAAIRVAGLLVAALTVFVFIATASYLFHWQQDMSLFEGGAASEIGNAAGKVGNRTGYFLVCELFGLGSFALLLILAAVSIRLLSHKWRQSLVKTGLIALFGACIASLAFAFIGELASLGDIFGGGLGGRCGATIVSWAEEQVGVPVTGIIIVVLIVALLIFSSRGFSRWLATVGCKKK